MPKITVYLPHDVYERAVAGGVPMAQVAQHAIMAAAEQDLSSVSAIERIAAELVTIAARGDNRVQILAARLTELGLDPYEVLAGMPYYFERLPPKEG